VRGSGNFNKEANIRTWGVCGQSLSLSEANGIWEQSRRGAKKFQGGGGGLSPFPCPIPTTPFFLFPLFFFFFFVVGAQKYFLPQGAGYPSYALYVTV